MAAYDAAGVAWGPCDGYSALPQAVQLQDRIAVGKQLYAEHQDPADPRRNSIWRRLTQLRREFGEALEDHEDQVRCHQWREAFERLEAALDRFVPLDDRLRELEESDGYQAT